MLTVDDRLRAAAAEVMEYTTDLPLPELDPGLRPAPTRTPTVRRGLIALVAAAVVLLIAVGSVALWTFTGDEEPVVTTVPPTTTTLPATTTVAPTTTTAATSTTEAATSTTTTIPAVPDALRITWQQVEAPVLEGGWIAGITEGGPGLIAVGGARSGDIHPNNGQAFYQVGVWVSSDGANWERIESPDFSVEDEYGTGAAYMTDITVGPAGVVGVGWAGGQAAMWISPDGLDWRRIPHDDAVFGSSGEVRHVVASSFGLVAVGVATEGEGDEEVVAWLSANGSEWIRSPIGVGVPPFWSDPLSVATTRMDVVAWNDLVVVVGAVERDGEWTYRPAVWMTSDGITWETITDGSGGTIPVPEGNDAILATVAPYRDRLVAMGWFGDVANRRFTPAIWTSENGRDWEVGPGEFFTNGPGMSYATLATMGDQLVLASSFDKSGDLFGSADSGATWHALGEVTGGLGAELAATEGDRIYFTVNDVLGFGDAVIAAGRTLAFTSSEDFEGRCIWSEGAGRCRTDAAIWIGNWED